MQKRLGLLSPILPLSTSEPPHSRTNPSSTNYIKKLRSFRARTRLEGVPYEMTFFSEWNKNQHDGTGLSCSLQSHRSGATKPVGRGATNKNPTVSSSRAYPAPQQQPPPERSPFGERLKAGETRRIEEKNNGRIVQRCYRRVALVRLYAFVLSPPSETPPTRLGQRFHRCRSLNSAAGNIGSALLESAAETSVPIPSARRSTSSPSKNKCGLQQWEKERASV